MQWGLFCRVAFKQSLPTSLLFCFANPSAFFRMWSGRFVRRTWPLSAGLCLGRIQPTSYFAFPKGFASPVLKNTTLKARISLLCNKTALLAELELCDLCVMAKGAGGRGLIFRVCPTSTAVQSQRAQGCRAHSCVFLVFLNLTTTSKITDAPCNILGEKQPGSSFKESIWTNSDGLNGWKSTTSHMNLLLRSPQGASEQFCLLTPSERGHLPTAMIPTAFSRTLNHLTLHWRRSWSIHTFSIPNSGGNKSPTTACSETWPQQI